MMGERPIVSEGWEISLWHRSWGGGGGCHRPITEFCLPGSDPVSHGPETELLEDTVGQHEEPALS